MEIIHISAECYPVAKVGGLADVVGALPKYQQQNGDIAKVVIPCYKTRFLFENEFELVHQGGIWMGSQWRHFNVIKEKHNKLGFDLYLVDIPGLLDNEQVYGHHNDPERFLGFQIATLDWIRSWRHRPDVLHCHDHHAALIPFMITQCSSYARLEDIPTVLTIHNAQYQGQFGWDRWQWLPAFDWWKSGLLDWDHAINPLASAIKCSWRVTTVSPGYLDELMFSAAGLESLLQGEKQKCSGILNGIDTEVWNPADDEQLPKNYTTRNLAGGKKANKEALCSRFGLNPDLPLVSFIGRLVGEKGADLLPGIIGQADYETDHGISFLVLGSGDPYVAWQLEELKTYVRQPNYNVYIGYDEALSHCIYAGSDFLLMPSRVEPCGLNQLYALRYGTVPVVRMAGGLKDTVIDFGDEGGYGIRFMHPSVADACHALRRSVELFQQKSQLGELRRKMMKLDFSWKKSARQYADLYSSLK
ncbi:glycogen synthase [Compostibacter hankyongensis]|uniref:Glycogen synthase n=1 Tax=Compostibacter hankyongensis TaxID=1007089 RepID=A0ABP8FLH9_9BACT